jgi:hypothetical protein
MCVQEVKDAKSNVISTNKRSGFQIAVHIIYNVALVMYHNALFSQFVKLRMFLSVKNAGNYTSSPLYAIVA